MKHKNKVYTTDYKWIALFLVLDVIAFASLPLVLQ